MRQSVPLILAALLSTAAISGCGLKNDLYLPEQPSPVVDQPDLSQPEINEPEQAENEQGS